MISLDIKSPQVFPLSSTRYGRLILMNVLNIYKMHFFYLPCCSVIYQGQKTDLHGGIKIVPWYRVPKSVGRWKWKAVQVGVALLMFKHKKRVNTFDTHIIHKDISLVWHLHLIKYQFIVVSSAVLFIHRCCTGKEGWMNKAITITKNFNIDMVVEAPALAELQLVSVFAHIPPPITTHPH